MRRTASSYLELESFVFPIRPRDIPESVFLLSLHKLCTYARAEGEFKEVFPWISPRGLHRENKMYELKRCI